MSQLLENVNPKEDTMELYAIYSDVRPLQLGDWVQFPETYMHCNLATIPAGTRGHVIALPDDDDDTLEIYLHSTIDALAPWDNVVMFHASDYENQAEFERALRDAFRIAPKDTQMEPTILLEWHLRKVKTMVDNALMQVEHGGHYIDYVVMLQSYLTGDPRATLDASQTNTRINDYLVSLGC